MSSKLSTQVIHETESPSFTLNILTPWVILPKLRISDKLVRIIWAFFETIYTSLSSETTWAEAITPVFFVMFEVFIPVPPLFCVL